MLVSKEDSEIEASRKERKEKHLERKVYLQRIQESQPAEGLAQQIHKDLKE